MARNKSEKVVPTIWLQNGTNRIRRVSSLGLVIHPFETKAVTDFKKKDDVLCNPEVMELRRLGRIAIYINPVAMDGP